MIEAVKIEDVGIEIAINGVGVGGGSERCEVTTDSFDELRVKITNRTTELIYPLIRIQPSVRNQPHNMSLDLSKKFVWNGTLQQALPVLPGKESTEVVIGITPLCRGEFEISASVEEARLVNPPEEPKKGGEGRPRANTRQMMDAVLGARERRIWHSREPCLVVVRDEETDDE